MQVLQLCLSNRAIQVPTQTEEGAVPPREVARSSPWNVVSSRYRATRPSSTHLTPLDVVIDKAWKRLVFCQIAILPLTPPLFLGGNHPLVQGTQNIGCATLPRFQFLGYHGKTLADDLRVYALLARLAVLGVEERHPECSVLVGLIDVAGDLPSLAR
jgi:hypothetical protein